MRRTDARKLARAMRRYTSIWCSDSEHAGPYVKQSLIRLTAHRAQMQAERKLGYPENRLYYTKSRWIPITKLQSYQRGLRYRALIWQLSNKCSKLPDVVKLRNGDFLIWNGNHRITAAIMRGATRVRCCVLKK
jgi:hypothetical protein